MKLYRQLWKVVGRYVFLMDGEGRMRWRGSGTADSDEVESLLRCTRGLLSKR